MWLIVDWQTKSDTLICFCDRLLCVCAIACDRALSIVDLGARGESSEYFCNICSCLAVTEMGDGSAAAVQAECDRRLHILNCDSSSTATGSTSFDHLQWALSLLRHFRHQEERLGGDEAGISHGAAGEAAVGQMTKRKADMEPSVAEDEEDTEMENAGAEKTARPERSSPSQLNNDTSAGEGTKSDPGPERPKSDLTVDSLEEVVRRADSGKAGIRMAQIVGIWIGRRECHALVHLISHCLSKSLNQVSPFKGAAADILPEGVVRRGEVSNQEEGAQPPSESLWLHKWLVREVMQNNTSSHRSPLDWLVAHLTAASPSLFLGAVINDLWENVTATNASSMVPLAIYVRRIGVLEYAALRGSEQVAVELQRVFSEMGFVGSPKGEGRANDLQPHQKKRLVEMWSMWLVTATLCPKLLAACSRHWVPCLTVQTFEFCNSLFVDVIDVKSPLTSLWFILEGVNQEEPKRLSAWLAAVLSRRIRELAPVGTALIVLLNRLVRLSNTDRLMNELLECATSLLQKVCMDLSVLILPRVIGTEQTIGAEPLSFNTKDEYTGYSSFIGNLKMNLKNLWAELLSDCSQSFSRCDAIATALSPDKDVKCTGIEPGFPLHPSIGGKGWWNGDSFVGVCRITILSSGHSAIAELLGEETVASRSDSGGLEEKSVRRLLFVMEVMKMVAGQGRGVQVFEIWSQLCVASFTKSDDEKAFEKALAIKQLLDPMFWQSHQSNLIPYSMIEQSPDTEDDLKGISWKVVWTLLRKVMDSQWLHLVPLLHRKNAWELHLVVLFIFQSLSPGSDAHPQAVVVRLKGLLGMFFQLVEEPLEKMEVDKTGKWLRVQVLEHLKRVIVQQASSSFACFTVMVSSLLDYSFERSDRKAEASPWGNNNNKIQRRGVGASGRGLFPTSTLGPERLDQCGSFTLLSVPALKENNSSLASPKFSLREENRRMRSAGLPSLGKERLVGSIRRREDVMRPAQKSSNDDKLADTTIMELGDLLRRTVGNAVQQAAQDPEVWSPYPAYILASQMKDRLATPHELAMKMEQYEEVLPKQVSSPRHIFLTECFGHIPLLLEMLELVVKYRRSDEVLCVEFIRVLLVNSISRWHSAYRTRRDPGLPLPRVFKEEGLDRMHVIRLVTLVADTGWLPQPLASTIEIIEVIDGADVADLLLLVWRCMHHAMASGTKGWGGNSDSVVAPQIGPASEKAQNQVMESGSGRDETYTDWEGHLFAILRQNIAQIGAHFAQVYPEHDTL